MHSIKLKAPTPEGVEVNVWAVVTSYQPALPTLITGTGYGDALPPEPEEIEWHLATREDGPPSEALHCAGIDLDAVEQQLLSRSPTGPRSTLDR